jgi:hypothetical protein
MFSRPGAGREGKVVPDGPHHFPIRPESQDGTRAGAFERPLFEVTR